jgi:hypothetical protein
MEENSLNILERVIIAKVFSKDVPFGPRILVRRRSLLPADFAGHLERIREQPGFPLSLL